MKKRKLCMIFLLCLALMTLVAGCRSKTAIPLPCGHSVSRPFLFPRRGTQRCLCGRHSKNCPMRGGWWARACPAGRTSTRQCRCQPAPHGRRHAAGASAGSVWIGCEKRSKSSLPAGRCPQWPAQRPAARHPGACPAAKGRRQQKPA